MNASWKDRLESLGETLKDYAARIPLWVLGLIALYLLLLLVGCASSPTQPTTVKVTEVRYLPVPVTLTQRHVLPGLEGDTNADLYNLVLAYRRQLLQCNADKEQIEQLVVPSR